MLLVAPLAGQETERRDSVSTDTTKLVETVHPQDLEEARFEIKWRGYVKFNAFFDYNGMKSTEGFYPYEIPVDPELNKNLSGLYAGARQSRLGMETNARTRIGKIRTYIEMDFAGDNTGLSFRLRHAFGQIGYWTLGHTWTTFSDIAAVPNTVDLEGPNSGVFVRHGLIRFERKIATEGEFGVSLENPRKDFENPYDTLNIDFQQSFDLAGRFRLELDDEGHLQLAFILRELFYSHPDGPQFVPGYGLQISGRLLIGGRGRISTQMVYGSAISRYITTLSGRGLDIYPRPDGTMDPLRALGGYLSYEHFWNDKWSSSIIGGLVQMWNSRYQPMDAFRSSLYGSSNTFWRPIETLEIGLEFVMGNRTDQDLQRGTATRIQFGSIFYF